MNIIDRMQMLNNNKLARMIMEMADANCRCTNHATEVKEIAKKAIMNPAGDIYADLKLEDQSKLLQEALVKLHERTATFTGTVTRIKRIKDSDEVETLRNEESEPMI